MLTIDGNHLTLEDFVAVARHHEKVRIAEESIEKVHEANAYINSLVEKGDPVYGVNTGFGHLSELSINRCDTSKSQENLLLSHACGVGDVLDGESVRGMLLLRINALIKGYSGIRLIVIEKLLELLNKNCIPVVFSKGSLGASGDLAMLAHMALPILGHGEVLVEGERRPAKEGLQKFDIEPIRHLEAKEGLCLINGTQAMNSIGALALYDALHLERLASASLSMSMEALGGIIDVFDGDIHQLRNHQGQIDVAKRMRHHLKGSTYVTKQAEERIQDAYSLRCSPQVHGATLSALRHCENILVSEMNAVTDNPLVFPGEDKVLSAGNFHGQPLALALDYLAIAVSELANISERRIERMVNDDLSNGLPPFLTEKPGLNSGFMIVQYSAASLVSENKVLAHPGSVDSIPSSANQEDHVSMGMTSARKAREIIENTQKVLAMELLCAAQAIDFKDKGQLGKMSEVLYHEIRGRVQHVETDTLMYPHIHRLEKWVMSDDIRAHLKKEEFHA